jgi:hypothetical protein
MLGGSFGDINEKDVARIYGFSLTIIQLALHSMIQSHDKLTNWKDYYFPPDKPANYLGICLTLHNNLVLLSTATMGMWLQDPPSLAIAGFIVLWLLSLARIAGMVMDTGDHEASSHHGSDHRSMHDEK